MRYLLTILLVLFMAGSANSFGKKMGVVATSSSTLPTPTAHYLFENDVTDEEGNHDGTAETGFTYSTTYAYEGTYSGQFDSDDYVTVSDHADWEPGTGDFSISVVFRSTYVAGQGAVIGKQMWDSARSGWDLTFAADGSLSYRVHNNSGTTTTIDSGVNLADDTVYHIVLSFDADATSEAVWYISEVGETFGDIADGTAVNCDVAPPDTTVDVTFGYVEVDENILYGVLDDLRWYKGAVLSADDAEDIYDTY